ncbi:N-acetyltransferase [Pontimonas sp.]|nr:GNAT family N-acetyltransferase [Pontimonas sp.]MDA9114533.1 N-acetyltransferase [Pontimonas sp.]
MEITHEPQSHRYVLSDGEQFLGEVEYYQEGTTLNLVRAEVPLELRGEGLGIPLVKGTLEAIRAEGGLSVRPICPYIAKYMMKNSEFDDLKG